MANLLGTESCRKCGDELHVLWQHICDLHLAGVSSPNGANMNASAFPKA